MQQKKYLIISNLWPFHYTEMTQYEYILNN